MRTGVLAAIGVMASAALLAGGESKPERPKLALRATPRVALSPVSVLAVAELKGVEDAEDYYCPEVEWDWDDGSRSIHESDCPPFEPGTAIDRHFRADHVFRGAGVYDVQVRIRRGGRVLARAGVTVDVREGLGQFR